MGVELQEVDDYQTPIWPTGPLDFGDDDTDDGSGGRSESALVVLHDPLITSSFHLTSADVMDCKSDRSFCNSGFSKSGIQQSTFSITFGSRGEVEITEDSKPLKGKQNLHLVCILRLRHREMQITFLKFHVPLISARAIVGQELECTQCCYFRSFQMKMDIIPTTMRLISKRCQGNVIIEHFVLLTGEMMSDMGELIVKTEPASPDSQSDHQAEDPLLLREPRKRTLPMPQIRTIKVTSRVDILARKR